MNFRLPLVSVIKEIGILGLGQFLQLLLMVFSRLFHTFVKFIFGRTGDLMFLSLVRLRPARRKNAPSVDRFPDF